MTIANSILNEHKNLSTEREQEETKKVHDKEAEDTTNTKRKKERTKEKYIRVNNRYQ